MRELKICRFSSSSRGRKETMQVISVSGKEDAAIVTGRSVPSRRSRLAGKSATACCPSIDRTNRSRSVSSGHIPERVKETSSSGG